MWKIHCVPLGTEPGISLVILQLMRSLQRNLNRIIGLFHFISHKTNVILLKFLYNICIRVRIIKEMPGWVASGTYCIILFKVKYPTGVICRNSKCFTNRKVILHNTRYAYFK